MERHKCKLCMRSFSNGRALGGHMRSHMMNLPIPPRPEEYEEQQQEEEEEEGEAIPIPPRFAIDDDEEGDEDEDEDEDEESLYYGLRENPKRSIRLVDHEFSFAVEAAGCVVLQDRESETESSKNPTRRRSKRTRKSAMLDVNHHHHKFEALKKIKLKNKVVISSKTDSVEPEPVSSISDATTEEDVAFCLMMLSRDKWKKQELQDQLQHEYEHEDDDEAERSMEDTDESEEQLTIKYPKPRPTRGKYKCETCNKVFKSYQALGGHRASHKKIKALNPNPVYEPDFEQENNAGTSSSVPERKIHECPVCFRVFASGQALGGHKRSHVTGAAAAATTTMKSLSKLGDNLIDLNLPAPVDDDDEISQIELSAVSDAEFVNPIRR